MPILCALAFPNETSARARVSGPNATELAGVAAVVAAKLGETLCLLHVDRGAPNARHQLLEAAIFARGICPQVEEELVAGTSPRAVADLILEVVRRRNARHVFAGSSGRRGPSRYLIESVPEALVRASPAPVWIVRDSVTFAAWLRGERPLRVAVGASLDRDRPTVPWVPDLDRIGRCDATIIHAAWPPELHDRYAYHADMELDRLPDLLVRRAGDELRAAADQAGLPASAPIVVEAGYGRPDHHLAVLAERMHADVVLAGGHRRSGVLASWQTSFTRGILRSTQLAVISVPVHQEPLAAVGHVRTVLAATDFSDAGDRACKEAFALLPNGGKVHLLHVRPRADEGSTKDEVRRRTSETSREHLVALSPSDANARGIDLDARVEEGDPATVIAEVADRVGADIVCIGAESRSPSVVRRVLGATSGSVLAKCSRPVLVVR